MTKTYFDFFGLFTFSMSLILFASPFIRPLFALYSPFIRPLFAL